MSGITDFQIICDEPTPQMIDDREMRVEMYLPIEDHNYDFTFLVQANGEISEMKFVHHVKLGGRWFVLS